MMAETDSLVQLKQKKNANPCTICSVTLLRLQPRFGDKPVEFQVICPLAGLQS